MREFLKRLLGITVPSLLACFVCGELFFRFVLPASQMPWGYYDSGERIARFEQGQGSGTYTIGRFASQRGRWRINNMGWNSDIDYQAGSVRPRPLIAVIGDSYIEALQVDTTASIVSVLRRKLRGQYDVYGFGKSGAPLSQYLQMTRYVTKRFNPSVIVVNVVHNDFDESLTSVRQYPYFLGVDMSSGRPTESTLSDRPISVKRRTKIVFSSAIVRYLWTNLGLGGGLTERTSVGANKRTETAAAAALGSMPTGPERLDIDKAVDYLVAAFVQENRERQLVFMIDAPRKDIYAGTLSESSVLWMNQELKDVCRRHGCRVIDLTEPFAAKYQRDHERLSGDEDYHWNVEGHRYAADVLYQNLVGFGIVH